MAEALLFSLVGSTHQTKARMLLPVSLVYPRYNSYRGATSIHVLLFFLPSQKKNKKRKGKERKFHPNPLNKFDHPSS